MSVGFLHAIRFSQSTLHRPTKTRSAGLGGRFAETCGRWPSSHTQPTGLSSVLYNPGHPKKLTLRVTLGVAGPHCGLPFDLQPLALTRSILKRGREQEKNGETNPISHNPQGINWLRLVSRAVGRSRLAQT